MGYITNAVGDPWCHWVLSPSLTDLGDWKRSLNTEGKQMILLFSGRAERILGSCWPVSLILIFWEGGKVLPSRGSSANWRDSVQWRRVLHLGRNNPMYLYMLRADCLESSLAVKYMGVSQLTVSQLLASVTRKLSYVRSVGSSLRKNPHCSALVRPPHLE